MNLFRQLVRRSNRYIHHELIAWVLARAANIEPLFMDFQNAVQFVDKG